MDEQEKRVEEAWGAICSGEAIISLQAKGELERGIEGKEERERERSPLLSIYAQRQQMRRMRMVGLCVSVIVAEERRVNLVSLHFRV